MTAPRRRGPVKPRPKPRPEAPSALRASTFERIYTVVASIPRGRVATYAQVARAAAMPQGARTVGWALRALRGAKAARVPWHRVVAARGAISLPPDAGGAEQIARLRAEGVCFRGGRVALEHLVQFTLTPS